MENSTKMDYFSLEYDTYLEEKHYAMPEFLKEALYKRYSIPEFLYKTLSTPVPENTK